MYRGCLNHFFKLCYFHLLNVFTISLDCQLIYCALSAGGRRHWVFEVWEGAVAGAGRCHLPPHEDAVSSWLVEYVSTLKCKLRRGTFPTRWRQVHTDISQPQTLFFVTLIIDKYAKCLKWTMWRTESAEQYWFPFVCPTFLASTCNFLTLFFCVLQRGRQTEGGNSDPHTKVSARDNHRGPRVRRKILRL